jgi:predicted porin
VVHPVTVNGIANGSFAAAILVLLTATSLAFAQQPAPPPPQPGAPPQPAPPAGPQQPGVPAQPQQQPGAPGQPQPPAGQEPAPTTEAPPAPAPLERGSAGGVVPEDLLQADRPTITTPATFLGPDLFNPPVPRGWITVTPTFTLSGEYNDNIFKRSEDVKSDFIAGFIPGVTLSMQRPEYRLLAGYSMTSEIFAKESDESGFANRHQLFADGFYRLSPRTRLTLRERFIYDEDTSSVDSDNVSSGRRNSLRNTATFGVQHELSELTTLRASVSQTHRQFSGDPDARDSDTFRLLGGADYQFTARLRGIAEFESAYLTVKGESDAFTQRPRLGFDYQFTQTLSGGLIAGPSFLIRDNDTDLKPTVTAQLAQFFSFGSLRAGYDYSVTAGTFGIANRHSIFATLAVNRLVRNLLFEVTPRYTNSDFEDRDTSGTDRRQSEVMTLNLRATYQLTQALALIGSYTFFHQKDSNGTSETIDQNRVFLGVQYAFPITFY